LALPVVGFDTAAGWHSAHRGMPEVDRRATPRPAPILRRGGIGFGVNGHDASRNGAAIRVAAMPDTGTRPGARRTDNRDGPALTAVFVVGPIRPCHQFRQPAGADSEGGS